MRNFQIYPRIPDASAKPTSSWLEKLSSFGTIAMKLFTFALALEDDKPNADKSAAVVGSTQSILIGADDLLFSSAIMEKADVGVVVPVLDYKQGRLNRVVIRITPGAEMGRRGGRVCAAVITLLKEEIDRYRPDKTGQPWGKPDSYDFATLIQLPGAVTAPASSSLSLSWRPKPIDYGFRMLGIGAYDYDNTQPDTPVIGGDPVIKLVIGYQDYASTKSDPTSTYLPEEAMLHVDIRGHVTLTENGRTYMRAVPPLTSDSSKIAVTNAKLCGVVFKDVEFSDVKLVGGVLKIKRTAYDSAFHPKGVDLEGFEMMSV